MNRHIKTIDDAAREWVNGFNAIDQGMIADLMAYNPEDWHEITAPTKYDRVYVYCQGEGEIVCYDQENDLYVVKMDSDNSEQTLGDDEFEVQRDEYLPMWSMMWSFGNAYDDEWLSDHGGLRKMSECGFRVYESDKYGYFFGIDGAGYSFYEEHWIPLYKARGLHWHNEEDN